MWVIQHSIADWAFFKTQILLVTLRIQHQHPENHMYLYESNICFQSVGCAGNKQQCLTVPQSEINSCWCWFANGRCPCSWLLGCGDRSVTFVELREVINPKKSYWKTELDSKKQQETACACLTPSWKREVHQNVRRLSSPDHVTTNATPSQCEAQWYIFEDSEAVIKGIIHRRSSMMRRVRNLQSRVRLVVWQNQLGHHNPTQICWHERTTRRLVKTKEGLRVVSGGIFFVCLTSLIFLSPAAIFFQMTRRTPCRRDCKEVDKRRGFGSETKGLLVWLQHKPIEREATLSLSSDASNVPGDMKLDSECIWKHHENWRGTKISNVFARGIKTIRVQEAAVNCSVVLTINLREDQVTPPERADLRLTVRWESLQERASKMRLSSFLHSVPKY